MRGLAGITFDTAPAEAVRRRKLPEPIAGASWQAGVTPDSDSFRVFVDGEPQPLCFAACAGQRGWAKIYIGHETRHDHHGTLVEGLHRNLYGNVEVRKTRF